MARNFLFHTQSLALIVLALTIYSPLSANDDPADLDSTNPVYNRAVNPLIAPQERLEALENLLTQKGFEEMENLFATLLRNPKQPVIIKNFIIKSAKEQAGVNSPLGLDGILKNKDFDAQARRIALWELWQAELLEARDLERIIHDRDEDPALREYAVSVLRKKSGSSDRESLRILEELAVGTSTEEPLRIQAIGSLSQDLESPQTLGLFQRIAQDKTDTYAVRRLVLLNIKATDEILSAQLNRQIFLDPRENVDLRIFTFEITSDETILERFAEVKQLESTTAEPSLKSVIAERLASLEK
ncbi:MAG: hypothetical protein HY587_04980 [Candidatus Omnitrophica bacterium]|nr:hypothetical protein [Candidatus Omnitrophota bacterium]